MNMEILNSNKIELTCDDYKMEFTLAINDVYGHYIDETKLSKEEIIDLFHALQKLDIE
jgi:hypothetical protein